MKIFVYMLHVHENFCIHVTCTLHVTLLLTLPRHLKFVETRFVHFVSFAGQRMELGKNWFTVFRQRFKKGLFVTSSSDFFKAILLWPWIHCCPYYFWSTSKLWPWPLYLCTRLLIPETIKWFIEDQALSTSYDSAPPPPSPISRQLAVSLSESSCVSPVELTDGRWGK